VILTHTNAEGVLVFGTVAKGYFNHWLNVKTINSVAYHLKISLRIFLNNSQPATHIPDIKKLGSGMNLNYFFSPSNQAKISLPTSMTER
jgi:hypothetical protein